MNRSLARLLCVPLIAALVLAGCAVAPPAPESVERPRAGAVLGRLALDRATEDRILALDPGHVTEADIRGPLARAPAPQIILLHGGIYPVYLIMVSFGHFLVGMGYPERSIRDPGTRAWSYSPYEEGAKLAGIVAWHYEHEGMRPMLIGHSQGGMQAVKILHELAGHFEKSIPVFNPATQQAEDRTTIVDPLSRKTRPVVGLSTSYVSVVGAGGAAFLLPNQWDMVGKLRSIPDTVDDFTGYFIALDLIAWSFPGDETDVFKPNGTAKVRNVELPGTYSHVMLPAVQDLAQDPATRAKLNAYAPGKAGESGLANDKLSGALWAADVWYMVKKHWVLELQQLIRARRAAEAAGTLPPVRAAPVSLDSAPSSRPAARPAVRPVDAVGRLARSDRLE